MPSRLKLPYLLLILLSSTLLSGNVLSANYTLDPTHSFVEWRVQHLGYSWLYGRFNNIRGTLTWDENSPETSRIDVRIEIGSVDSNHVERDKHLRSKKFLNAEAQPIAHFTSQHFRGDANGGELEGELSLNGLRKNITLQIKKLGEGNDPWGGYRVGFEARYTLHKKDWGFDYKLGSESDVIELELGIEGIRQQKHVKR